MFAEQVIDEKKLAEFVTRIREAAGTNLVSVILFGSGAAGDFHPEYSNLNLFCVVRDGSFRALEALAPVAKWWDKQKQPPPLVMTREEIERSTDVFTIEMLDMQQHHRLLYGEDVLKGLSIPLNLHRIQIEYELREKLSLLRQHFLLAAGNDKLLWELMLRSVSSFATLFRHAQMVFGDESPIGKRESIKILAERVGFDASAFLQVLDVREQKVNRRTLDAADVFARYLAAVEHVTAAVDKMLDSGGTKSL
jgi:predicted nucleotidyltransferase